MIKDVRTITNVAFTWYMAMPVNRKNDDGYKSTDHKYEGPVMKLKIVEQHDSMGKEMWVV